MKCAMSYSFGKDSALALYKMIQAGNEPVCLITTTNEENGRSWTHGINPEVMQRVVNALNLPIITAPCYSRNYAHAFERALKTAAEMGAECCAFGDMDINQHLEWNKARCAAAGIECVAPLWGINREQAVAEMLSLGFTAIIKCVEKIPWAGVPWEDPG
jgi:diphthamide synthase (EF-2-diphthine--ammonia ligase)